MAAAVAREVKTACPYCGVGCGVLAKVGAGGEVTVRGDPDHPANFGRLCSKGSALGETVDLDGRLLYPEIGGHRVGWDAALDHVAERFLATIARHGPDSVAFYVSGQLLTEDYYVANKLMKGFIGSANIDTNSRLCMASTVAGHRRAFGSDTVPGTYEDLDLADLIVLVGSNLAWCHPVLFQRIAAAKEKRPRTKVVLIDPRRTMTADIADHHLAIAADGDIALFAGLLAFLNERGALDPAYIAAHTTGFAEALSAALPLDMAKVATGAGIDETELIRFFTLFAETPRTVTVFSQGVNQSSRGADKVNAIINCHLATGRIGKPGTGPFSVTGQPNAMGGREVGGLANTLAAHMEIENPAHRDKLQRFWNSNAVAAKPGLKAVDMFRAVADGRIKALWIMATNPAVSMPDADAVEAAIKACPFVVVSDVAADTDTVRHAHVRLPAAAWGEKDGTVTNSERRISRQRAFLPLPGEARPDWRIVADVASRMGFGAAFGYTSPAEIFAEHAALSAFENAGDRDFDIGAYAGIGEAAFAKLAPFQWPQTARATPGETRFFANGGYFTPDRKARFVAIRPASETRVGKDFPLILNTGRVRDHWHTMTRTGKSPRLSQHMAEPFAEIHPSDAASLCIGAADIVRISTPDGEALLRALVTARQRQGSVFVPIHWSDRFASLGRASGLVAPLTDALSGQPAFKHVAARLEKFAARAFGFAVMRERPVSILADYWALARCRDGWRVEFAVGDDDLDWTGFAMSLLGAASHAETIAYHDRDSAQHRFAAFDGDRLSGALFIAPQPVSVSRAWAVEQLAKLHFGKRERYRIVAGRSGDAQPDAGATVCSCFNVGVNQIASAAAAGCRSVEDIGKALGAGTNCGSCRAEIRAIVDARHVQAAE